MIVPYNNNKNSSALVWRNTVSMLGTIVRQYSAVLCPCLALKCASIAQCSYNH